MSGQRASMLALAVVFLALPPAWADVFGTGANQFTIDFVPISGGTNPTDTNPSGGYGAINYDYRMGVYEITNDQWNKFTAELGVTVTGDPTNAYDQPPFYTGANVPTSFVSWYEAAQFVNWLNTSTGHQAAYNFTGTQGTIGYALSTWAVADAWGGTNLYRHKDSFYFLPSEDEWVKAAYFNGTTLQPDATKPGDTLHQGDGTSGTGWNYDDGNPATPTSPWAVGSGSEELNGTYDMMGNVREWMESPASDPSYGAGSTRSSRGGAFFNNSSYLTAGSRLGYAPSDEHLEIGFRVASSVPEPGSAAMLLAGAMGLLLWRRRRHN